MLGKTKILALILALTFSASCCMAAEESAASHDESAQQSSAAKPEQPEPPEMEKLTGPVIESVELKGNEEVAAEHIMSVVTSKVGEHVDEEKLRKDADAIFELGFFSSADYKVTDEGDGVKVTFVVQENPKVG